MKKYVVNGFSLLEVMVALGILSIASIGILQLYATDQMRILSSRQTETRDFIKMLADRYIMDYKIIKKSSINANYISLASNFDGNQALDFCLNGPPSAPNAQCPVGVYPDCCKAVTNQPFNLIEPSDPTNTNLFSGTDQATGGAFITTAFSPARYDINGSKCTTASPDCSLELVTSFSANCPSTSPLTCSYAEAIFISYSLRGAAGVTPKGGTPFKPLGPSAAVSLALPTSDTSEIIWY